MNKQLTEAARDVVLIIVAAVLSAVSPLVAQHGVLHVTASEWLGALDHVLTAVILGVGVLAGTPITRRYGVGAPALTAVVPPPPTPPAAPYAVPAQATPDAVTVATDIADTASVS